MAVATADALTAGGYKIRTTKDASSGSSSMAFFDTFLVDVKSAGGSKAIQAAAASNGVNVRIVDENTVGLSFGEAITRDDCVALLKAFKVDAAHLKNTPKNVIPDNMARTSEFMTHHNFNSYHSETQMLRYMKHLENKDLSLNYSAIMLGRYIYHEHCVRTLRTSRTTFDNDFLMNFSLLFSFTNQAFHDNKICAYFAILVSVLCCAVVLFVAAP
jgi:hypothetical protein